MDQISMTDHPVMYFGNQMNKTPTIVFDNTPGDHAPDDSDDEDSDRTILSVAIEVWRANIKQYMSKLEVEMISAHNIPAEPRSIWNGLWFARYDREAYYVSLRYGKTMQKTLVASSHAADPVNLLCTNNSISSSLCRADWTFVLIRSDFIRVICIGSTSACARSRRARRRRGAVNRVGRRRRIRNQGHQICANQGHHICANDRDAP